MRLCARACTVVCVAVASWMAPAVWAFDACAASPDGTLVVVGGANRAIYVYKAPAWEIVHRAWMRARVVQIAFTPDGTQCVVLGDDKTARVLNVTDWKEKKRLENVSPLAVARQAPVAVSTGRKRGGGWQDRSVIVWSLPDWKPAKEIDLPKGAVPAGMAVSADGKTAYIRTKQIKDPKEKQVDPGPEPKGWEKKHLWRARKDGWVSDVLVVDVGQGAVVKTVRCFDTSHNYRMYAVDDGLVIANYHMYFGLVDATAGKYEVVHTGRHFAYGSGRGPKGHIYTGSLATYRVVNPNGQEVANGKISKLAGWPEYFKAFTPVGTQHVVGVTDAFRLIVIDAEKHTVEKEIAGY